MSRFSADAETSVVGAILIDNAAIDKIAHIIVPEDFAIEACRLIYESAGRLIMHGLPADPITVMQDLDERNDLERAGGLEYIGALYRDTPSAANVHRYAEVVRNYSRERAMLAAINEAHGVIHGDGSTVEKIAIASDLVLSAADKGRKNAQITHAGELARQTLASIVARSEKGQEEGLSTGFVDLDRMTGKMKPGQLWVIAGRPAMGKSTLARNIAEHIAGLSGVLFISLEMDADELGECFTASLGHASFESITSGDVEGDNAMDISRGATALSNLKLAVATGTDTVPAIHAIARTESRRLGGLSLIVVDYLQLMVSPGEKDRQNEVAAISRGLKKLAMTLRVPVVALSQLSRALEQRSDKRPILSDLRESGAIEQDADKVIFLYRDDYYNPDSPYRGMAEAIIAKNRRGKTGKVPMTFIGDQSRFADCAPDFRFEQIPTKPTRPRGFE